MIQPTLPHASRKRPRATLRVMMALVMILAGWLGWIAHRARVQREAVASIVRAGGSVTYEDGRLGSGTKPRDFLGLRRRIGRDYFDTVWGVSADNQAVDDAVVLQIGRLTSVRWLGLQGASVTDSGLAGLAGLHELRTLHLRSAHVGGSGFRHLSGLRSLRNLHLRQTPITDENVVYLRSLTDLENLSFVQTRISDAAMKQLAALPTLNHLTLGSSRVSDDGLREVVRTGRPIGITVRPGTRITPEGLKAMTARYPGMKVVP